MSDVAVAGSSPGALTLGGTAGTPAGTAAVAGSAPATLVRGGTAGAASGTAAVAGSTTGLALGDNPGAVVGTAAVAGGSPLALPLALAAGGVATSAAGGWSIVPGVDDARAGWPGGASGAALRWEAPGLDSPWIVALPSRERLWIMTGGDGTMAGTLYNKYVADKKRATFKYSGMLAPGDTLSLAGGDATVTADSGTPAGSALTITTPVVTSTEVQALVSGGTAGSIYLVTCQAKTVGGEDLRINARVQIRANTEV